jgi:hypothetical protein
MVVTVRPYGKIAVQSANPPKVMQPRFREVNFTRREESGSRQASTRPVAGWSNGYFFLYDTPGIFWSVAAVALMTRPRWFPIGQ